MNINEIKIADQITVLGPVGKFGPNPSADTIWYMRDYIMIQRPNPKWELGETHLINGKLVCFPVD